ncbi:ParB N-terminal domain-containing protein [Streptomyces sp. S.PNR 29]|uniref:ParB/RepB/Spo0J family partition protein n=1 Tax=Streptomyces sp. S.PNR 29 TaxID=2973805 RepID=UPI0025B07F2C|nr:ParB N-terminal domain-containing protein [Streptomyces sp. S.PNR 29]MDN0201118.1 ParB N-terminal domain-containing protein [Streptomyces sp. S.PNR 29]
MMLITEQAVSVIGAPSASKYMDSRVGRQYRMPNSCTPQAPFPRGWTQSMNGVPLSPAGRSALPVVTLTIAGLLPAHHIRIAGINEEHVRLLMSCGDDLPPLLVQKNTLRVIDGMHRLRAAQAAGRTKIQAQLLDVDDREAFLYGVSANIAHGLPLSLADRRAAARKILELHPEWSDRAVARAAGLSGKTVGALRTREGLGAPQPARRIGLDGRVRPVNAAVTGQAARELLAAKPEAPLREIARKVGAAPGTVRTVREHMADTTPPAAEAVAESTPPAGSEDPSSAPASDHAPNSRLTMANVDTILAKLRQDPALKYRATGRGLLRLLHQRPTSALSRDVMEAIPAHCAARVAALARIYACEWLEIAGKLENTAAAKT